MKFLNQIWKDIRQGENIDLYLTIVAALLLSGFSLTGQTINEKIPAITLAVLALLAVNSLVNRHRLEEALRPQTLNSFLMRSYPESSKDDIRNSKELWIVGYNLTQTLVEYINILDEKLDRGDKVKVLVLDPDGKAAEYTNRTLLYSMPIEKYRERIKTNLQTFSQIMHNYPSGLEIRIIDHPLLFATFAMDINGPNGKLYIKMYEYRAKSEGVRFILRPRDEYWYELYKIQLLALWNDAKPYSPSK